MESQEEYDKEVQELYDRIQQQMDQEIIEAKKRRKERQTPKIEEEEDKDALLNQTQLTLNNVMTIPQSSLLLLVKWTTNYGSTQRLTSPPP